MADTHTNGWFEKHVLAELDRIGKNTDKMNEDFSEFRNKEWAEFRNKTSENIAELKVKAGVWGFLAGIIPAIGTIIYAFMSSHK